MTSDETGDNKGHEGRSRRAVLRDGAAALSVLFVVGALVTVPRIQNDLKRSVNAALRAEGIEARVDFNGQVGTMRCVDKLDDPDAAVRVAESVDGVRRVRVDVSCLEEPPPEPGDTSTVPPTTVPPTTPPSSTAPTTTMTTITTSTVPDTTAPADEPVVRADLADGIVTLSGVVASEEQRDGLIEAAAAATDPSTVVDDLTVDPASELSDEDQSAIATLLAAMPVPLVRGTVGWSPAGVVADGVYVDEAARTLFEAAAAPLGVTPSLEVRPTGTADDALVIENELNEIVLADPILFGKGSVEIDLASIPTLQRVAGIAKRYAGLAIEVRGHTDSEGDPGRNLTLSEQRAASVEDALVALGVPSADVSSRGFGESELITDENGVEIPELSRRVVFGVTTS